MTYLWGRSKRKLGGLLPYACFEPNGRKEIGGCLMTLNN